MFLSSDVCVAWYSYSVVHSLTKFCKLARKQCLCKHDHEEFHEHILHNIKYMLNIHVQYFYQYTASYKLQWNKCVKHNRGSH